MNKWRKHGIANTQNNLMILFIPTLLLLLIVLTSCEPISDGWSPFSDKIAYVWHQKEKGQDVFIIGVTNVDKNNMLHLDYPLPLDVSGPGGFLSKPVWSPDNKYIAYYKISSALENDLGNKKSPKEHKDQSTVPNQCLIYSVQLIIVTPDGKQRKVLKNIYWTMSDVLGKYCLFSELHPTWSVDSDRIFFAGKISGNDCFIESIGIDGEGIRKHLSSSTGTVQISTDGELIGTVWKNTLVVSKVNGVKQKQFELKSDSVDPISIKWSKDLSKAVFHSADRIAVVDVDSEKIEYINNLDVMFKGDVLLSSTGEWIYFIAISRNVDNKALLEYSIRRVMYKNNRTETLFSLPKNCFVEQFSVSPDENIIAVIGTEKTQDSEQQTFLMIWNKKTSETFKATLGKLKGK